MELLDELRNKGCTVRISHYRIFNDVGAVPEESGSLDNILTRGQFERAKASKRLRYLGTTGADVLSADGKTANEVEYGKVVSPKGGFTTVKVTMPDGEVRTGKFNFNRKVFQKMLGIRAAVGKALKK